MPDKKTAELELRRQELLAREIRYGHRQAVSEHHSFHEVCEYWLVNRASRKRSGASDSAMIRNHLLPAFGKLALNRIGQSAIDQFISSKNDIAPKTLHNILTLLMSLLRTSQELRWLERIPKVRKPKISIVSTEFRYQKTHEEIDRFLRAAKNHSDFAYEVYATAIYSGMRVGEIFGLKWSDVDLHKGLIMVQRSFDGPTKNGEARVVPILNPIRPIFEKRSAASTSPFVFPTRLGTMHQPSARVTQEDLRQTLDSAGFPKTAKGYYLTFHSLRHTFASAWLMGGGDIFKLQRILGHRDIRMTLRYSHLCPDAYRHDLDRIMPPSTLKSPKAFENPPLSTENLTVEARERSNDAIGT
jgi:integrase